MGIVLASASPRRRELLALLGFPFRAVAAQVEEDSQPGEPPEKMVVRLARAKAHAVYALYPTALVIGCDTVVALESAEAATPCPPLLGKPADAEEARAMLLRLRGRTHAVYTGVALVGEGREVIEVATTAVAMRDYARDELDAYVASGDPLDKAGAYAIQHPAFRPVASWRGCYANVVGLPLCHLVRALRVWRVVPPADACSEQGRGVPAACQTHTGQRCTVFRDILAVRASRHSSRR